MNIITLIDLYLLTDKTVTAQLMERRKISNNIGRAAVEKQKTLGSEVKHKELIEEKQNKKASQLKLQMCLRTGKQ